MQKSSRATLFLVVIILVPVMMFLQAKINPGRKQFQPGKQGVASVKTQIGNNPVVLPGQFMVGALIGFREVISGLLWVRCDEFFHNGDYEAIVPLIRIITWLDPHNIDVYTTGGWHVAYNFVDSAQRADRRYLAPAIALEKEGVLNNPDVYDIKLSLGFDLYNMKVHNQEQSAFWLADGQDDPNAPPSIARLLAHAYEKAGKLDKVKEQWKYCMDKAQEVLNKEPENFGMAQHFEVCRKNLDGLLLREAMRADLPQRRTDLKFEAQFKRTGPRDFQVSGTVNLPDGARVDLELYDADYQWKEIDDFEWNIDNDVTALVEIGMHGLFVSKGKFQRKYELSKDTKQYPLKKDKYKLILTINPREAARSVQDVTGWNGEGITDSKYLDTSVPGLRRIRKVIELNREDII